MLLVEMLQKRSNSHVSRLHSLNKTPPMHDDDAHTSEYPIDDSMVLLYSPYCEVAEMLINSS
jgi:hypothetical protein